MSSDLQYKHFEFCASQIKHEYGDRFFLFSDFYNLTLLEKLGKDETKQPFLNMYVKQIYEHLLIQILNTLLPREIVHSKTRMAKVHSRGHYNGPIFKQDLKFSIINMLRAGDYPAHVCYELLCGLFNPDNIRQDHIFINRKTNENNEVVGVDFHGSKIGGAIDDHFLLIPDPMGATGSSMDRVLNFYKSQIKGTAKKIIAIHLVICPEYLKKMLKAHPDVYIVTSRLDRGNSSEDILKTIPGSHLESESGLNENQYILPGLGGVGEVLYNSYV